jgi:NADH/NAD ratio-sensing transcriptional regulator Rex
MIEDLSLHGICGVVDCSSCPVKVAGACAGCRERDAAIGGNGDKRCAIVVCSEARGQNSCLECGDFPCSVFRSPSSLYIPHVAENGSLSGCNVAELSRSPADTSKKFISRLATYLTVAEHHRRLGDETVTSAVFASALGIKPQLVRKDLLSLGHFGIPHVGFKLDMCIEALRETLNLKAVRNVVWVGAKGRYRPDRYMERLSSYGCRTVAILEGCDKEGSKPDSIGSVRVFDFGEVKRVVKNLAVVGAIIACEKANAQTAADTLIDLGITSILNLTPIPLDHPPNVFVKNIDLSEDIMLFSFYCGNN